VAAELKHTQEWNIKPSLNVHAEDVNVGVSAEHNTKDLTKLWAHLVYKMDNQQFWARFSKKDNWVGVGVHHDVSKDHHHAYEARYHMDKDFKGFQGQPVTLHHGSAYQLGDKTNFHAHGTFGQTWSFCSSASHKVDSHWTVGVHQDFDSANLAHKDHSPYAIGLNVAYKL